MTTSSKIFGVLALILITACNTVNDEEPLTAPDGNGDGEFQTVTAAGISLEYLAEDDSLHCILSATTTGWISVGLDPENQMQSANFVIGYVDDGQLHLRDDWGTSPTQHQSDLSLGGSDDVFGIAGTETDGITTLEFKIPLDSGDSYDRVLQIGQSYTVLFAKGNADDFGSYHSSRATALISL